MCHTSDPYTRPHVNIQDVPFVGLEQWLSLGGLVCQYALCVDAGSLLIGHQEVSCAFDGNDTEDVWSVCCTRHHCCAEEKTTLTQKALRSDNVAPTKDNISGRKMRVNRVC